MDPENALMCALIVAVHRERSEPSQIPRVSGQADTAFCHEQAEFFQVVSPGKGRAMRSQESLNAFSTLCWAWKHVAVREASGWAARIR
jgi:hypothetical protein